MRLVRNLIVATALLSCSAGSLLAQDEPATIRVKKESNLAKVALDNTENKLMVIDRFGNPRENKVVSYKLWIRSANDTRQFDGYSNSLTPDMLKALNSHTSAVKIFITEIVALDDQDHPQKLPDLIETWFPDCRNCTPTKKKRR